MDSWVSADVGTDLVRLSKMGTGAVEVRSA